MKKLVALVLTFLIILTGCKVTKIENTTEETDALKFSKEYSKVSEKNIYKYETYDNVIDKIKNGNGIIFFSYPSCVYCKEVAPILNTVAKENKIKSISYFNYKDMQKNNTSEYKELTKLLSDYIGEDEDGKKKLTAPSVLFIKDGNITNIHVGIVDSHANENEKMTEEEQNSLKEIYSTLIEEMNNYTTTTTTTVKEEQTSESDD